jgi:membrane dipeptidase
LRQHPFGQKFRHALVVDSIFVWLPGDENDARLFPRVHQAGFDFISVHPCDVHSASDALKQIAAIRAAVRAAPGCVFVKNVAEIRSAKDQGLLAVGLHLEALHCLEQDTNLVELFYDLGVRFAHPVFNQTNAIGGGSADTEDIGLTLFGKRVVAEMNRVGMLVDGAHASYRTSMDMMDCSSRPVLLTHHCVHRLRPHYRNLKDDQLKACATRGGLIGISGAGFYLGGPPTAELFFKHLDYVVQLVGAEHVMLGTDYLYKPEKLLHYIETSPSEWPGLEQGLWEPLECLPPEALPQVISLMVTAGYGDEAVRGILGENFLRLGSETWG